MGYHVSSPGVRELGAWRLYQDLLAGSTVRSVSSNLAVVEGGQERPAGLPFYVMDVSGVRVGFFALMGGSELSSARPPDGIEFKHQDPVVTAQRLVPEIRKQAEVVALISQMSTQETNDLLGKVQGIDIALYGRQPAFNETAQKVVNTLTQQTGIRGQFSGELVLIVDPDGRIAEWGTRNVALDAKFPENPEIAAQIKDVEAQAREMVKALQSSTESQISQGVHADRYLGVDKCQRCHEPQYKQWLGTKHATAFATLVKDEKQSDPACVNCHVTGWQKPGGFTLGTPSNPDLRNVQCESCHNVGTEHERGGGSVHMTEAVCTPCHTGEWAKGWNYTAYLEKVRH